MSWYHYQPAYAGLTDKIQSQGQKEQNKIIKQGKQRSPKVINY
jgi:hypothetical protein